MTNAQKETARKFRAAGQLQGGCTDIFLSELSEGRPRSDADFHGASLKPLYVPSDHPARYSSCSGDRRSILMPIDSSFSLATRLSSSSGTL